ncbi:long-chain-fatty-acid--CoA ligase 4-like, partial [Oppia nitens]|uniref:long-chain-fatty-acid--CoA ligase 4-like n=1 Tax=Oppia nitens TaxID=1686743 RepID=UPI0023DA9AE7
MLTLLITCVSIGILLYHIIPLTIHLCLQYLAGRPAKPVRGRPLDPNNPLRGPWVKSCDDDIGISGPGGAPVDESYLIAYRCSTIPELFGKIVDKHLDRRSCGYRPVLVVDNEQQTDGQVIKKYTLNEYHWLSYRELDVRVTCVATGLSKIGIVANDIVMIYANTCLDWMVTCQALFRLGATVATLYTNLSDDGIVHGLNETQVSYVVTSGGQLLDKLMAKSSQLPHLQCLIVMDSTGSESIVEELDKKIILLKTIETIGRESDHQIVSQVTNQSTSDTAVLMYTSGSTGIPKAVMISHKNLLLAIRAFYIYAGVLTSEDIYCAFLPLAHCMELCAELAFLSIGVPVGYATVHTLTDSSLGLKMGSKGDLTLLKPTVIATVPLILERIIRGISDQLNKRQPLLMTALNQLLRYKQFWSDRGLDCPLINRFICQKFASLLGGNVRFMASGGAPLRQETHQFISNLFDCRVLQGYGLTETTAAATIMDLDDQSVGRVGAPLIGVQIKLIDWPEGGYRVTDKPYPRGELIIGGDCVANGYFKNRELTGKYFMIDSKCVHWFRSGDIGERYPDGTFRIVDRKKDIIKLSNGEYVSLSKVEVELKALPFVANVCVYGHSEENYLIALIVPNDDYLNKLSTISSVETTTTAINTDNYIEQRVLHAIQEFCGQSGLTRAETPRRVYLCRDQWLPDNGLLTSSFKLKRNAIHEFYYKVIEDLYQQKQQQ